MSEIGIITNETPTFVRMNSQVDVIKFYRHFRTKNGFPSKCQRYQCLGEMAYWLQKFSTSDDCCTFEMKLYCWKEMRKKVLTSFVALSLIGAAAPTLAAPIDTFLGSASFSDTSPLANNPVYFTGSFANPIFSFAPTVLGQTYTDTLTVLATDSDLRSRTFTDNVSVALNFLLPNFVSNIIGGTGSLTDTFVFIGFYDSGTLSWGAPTIINFADGSTLSASMANLSLTGFDGLATGSGDLTLKLTRGPTAVPEPITLSLFGAGLLGAGALRRRKMRKAAVV